MNLTNQEIRGSCYLNGEKIHVMVNYDWVDNTIYINSINYDGSDIKSIITGAQEEALEDALYNYCERFLK